MPIVINLEENEILAPAYRRGLAEGRAERVEETHREMVLKLAVRRFGPAPKWFEERLAHASDTELLQLFDKLAVADSLDAAVAD